MRTDAALLIVSGLRRVGGSGLVGEQFAGKTPSLWYTVVINIVAVAVHFLI